MVATTAKKHPTILWAQRDNILFLTAEVEDMKIEELVVDGNKFLIRGTNGSGSESYEADLELYAAVKGDERRQIATARQVELVIPKETAEWWPRLLKKSVKVPWLKVDFNKWVDEDEVAENDMAGFDFNSMNFGGSDMLGAGGGLDEGESSGSEGDDEEMPPLEDVEPSKPESTATA
ncbi:CS domain and HSP20-like chaperone domain-containing protein [Aphelenchoides fujianensis]|nr:CS domain and HSP20-like chaperone domain-containing protein [Aphelenchoides fujianensis]KAI6225332.1 CS domain and HSP20-like chaperone domain-containing protein [Aphelenchoides fujianensis]